MKPLEPPDRHYLLAAQGWLELGNETEAFRELERIAPELRFHPEVVRLRWQIYGRDPHWQTVLSIARTICRLEPAAKGSVHRSKRRLLKTRLREVSRVMIGEGPIGLPGLFAIPYNLACYACQLGNVTEAWKWFEMALDMADAAEVRRLALEDSDLEPLWHRISRL